MGLGKKSLWLLGGCAFLAFFSAGRAQGPSKTGKKRQPEIGIYVDYPKVYDDSLLTTLQQNALQSLTRLTPFDQSTLLKGFGATQGSTVDQTALSAQVASGQTLSPQTTAVLNAQQPGLVSAPDLLNEETQLSSLIMGLQLLTQGALSDQLEPGTSLPKARLTLGFPISINVPPGYEYRNAVAEVQISVCAVEGTAGKKPSLVTLLPQAKTYNVASLVSRSSQIGGGAVSQVLNFQGSFLHSHQTYYLVKDQDTIAVQSPPEVPDRDCNYMEFGPDGGFAFKTYKPLVFGWQFKPVLGQRVVQDGLRQTFVQLSFSPIQASLNDLHTEENLSCEDEPVQIRAGWRHYDPQTGRVGRQIGEYKSIPTRVPAYHSPPLPFGVSVDDNGDGTLTVIAKGSFKPNTYVRIGSLVLGSNLGVPPPSGGTPANSSAGVATPGNNTPANTSASNPNVSTPATGASNNAGNQSPAPAASTAPASTTPGQTTLQIQGTVQIATAPSSPASPGSGNASAAPATPSGMWTTPNYIKFIAPASVIAQYGAKLVNPDGREQEIELGYSLDVDPTCAYRVAKYSQRFTPPAISSALSVEATAGVPFSYQIQATNSPTSYNGVGLPGSLSLDRNTGKITGTPTLPPNTRQQKYSVTLTATRGSVTGAPSMLELTISVVRPVITSPGSASGKVGDPFAYRITSANSPAATFKVLGLPKGLDWDPNTGWIGGVPSEAGTSTVTLSASDDAGTDNSTLTLTIAPVKPVITSALSASGTVNVPFRYGIEASGSPKSYAAPDLPPGLTLDATNGLISGTPVVQATQEIALEATNSGGSGSAKLSLKIGSTAAPQITSPLSDSGFVGVSYSYRITATPSPKSFNATGLPKGLTVKAGVISGKPEAAGTSTVKLTATSADGAVGAATLALKIRNQGAPVITSPSSGSVVVGVAYSYQIAAMNAPTSYTVSGAAGWAVDTMGKVSGTPAPVGTLSLTLTASNAKGTDTATLTLTILDAPVVDSAMPATGTVGVPFQYKIKASGSPKLYDAVSLPAGLSIEQTSGLISGIPLASGNPTVMLTAKNDAATSPSFSLTLNIMPAPPSEQSEVKLVPFSDTLTEVILTNVPLLSSDYSPLVPVVQLGSAVFGLRDHPFADPPADKSVRFFVPTSLLTSTPGQQMIWRYLFQPSNQRKAYPIPPQNPPAGFPRCAAASTISFVSTDGKNNHYAIRGQNLDDGNLKVIAPAPYTKDDGSSSTLFLFGFGSTLVKTAPAVILQCGSDAPVSVTLPPPPTTGGTSTGTSTTTATTTATTTTAKPTDKQQAYVGDGTIALKGSNMNDVLIVWYGSQQLQFAPAGDASGSYLTINDPKVKALTKAATIIPLNLYLSDKSYADVTVTVTAPPVSPPTK